jgi:hypothetical protein
MADMEEEEVCEESTLAEYMERVEEEELVRSSSSSSSYPWFFLFFFRMSMLSGLFICLIFCIFDVCYAFESRGE